MNPQSLVIGGIILIMAYAMFNNLVSSTGDFIRDTAADTIIGGDIVGIRSVEAANAADWIKKRLWLRKDYFEWLTRGNRLDQYLIYFKSQPEVEDIANDIIKANTVIFGNGMLDRLINLGLATANVGLFRDDPQLVVQAIQRIQNQAQALQVSDWYYIKVQKNLSAGLQWLPDEQMIQVYNHLHGLRTGVWYKTQNREITELPKPPINYV